MTQNQGPKFKTFGEVLTARGGCRLAEEVELAKITSTGTVVIREVRRGPEEDDYEATEIYRSQSLETFLVDVADAMGWKANIS